ALAVLATNVQMRVGDPGIAHYALGRISHLGRDNARCLIPALVQALGDPTTAAQSAEMLGQFGLESEVCVPALMRCMESADPRLRSDAVSALGSFGGEARSAVPVLVRKLNEAVAAGDLSVRMELRFAPRAIAPEVLEKRGHGGEKQKAEN